jgi:hypothetical protein
MIYFLTTYRLVLENRGNDVSMQSAYVNNVEFLFESLMAH